MKKNSKKVVNGVLAAGIILGGGTTALLANPQTTFAALGDQADVYYSDENPGKGEITISQSNTEDNPAYVSGYLGQYFKGYAHKSATGVWQYHVDGYGDKEGVYNTVTDGQTLRVYMSEGKQQGAFDILVHIKENTGTDNDSNTGTTKPSTGTDNDSNTGATKPSTGTDKVENNTVKNSNHTQTDSDQKAKKYSGDKLPKTGDSDSIYTMPIIGTILLLVAGAAAYINRKFIFGNK
ncbi:LPXTG cell wall anchor domain-containing protein [Bacillus sp. SPB7]|uniref:LPXTG cell wall anchor domain-containing protein n=1 Tax=Bacillus rugosus TaxID=2715209 RepID=UPI0015850903|nr:LPXTG cell wall anchor domain-containing protein [Bacillus rugosus]NUF07762.1 LPXTG cell wall anchor domain-containing protein [Bacillus rugosus]